MVLDSAADSLLAWRSMARFFDVVVPSPVPDSRTCCVCMAVKI